MGNTCKPMAVSFQCMTKSTTKKKKKNSSMVFHCVKVQLFIWPVWKTGEYLGSFSVQFSCSVVSDSVTPWTAAHQACLVSMGSQLCPSQTHGVYSNSCPLSQWCHPTISSSVVPFSSCLQSFPASASFQMSQFIASGSQNIGVSASASVLPMNIQDWFPLGLTDLISLQSKGFSSVFSNTKIQKHQFFGAQLSL